MMAEMRLDPVVLAARKFGYVFAEQVFWKAADDAGYKDYPGSPQAKMRAQALYETWDKQGYAALPEWVRDFCEIYAPEARGAA